MTRDMTHRQFIAAPKRQVCFTTSREEFDVIDKIASRAVGLGIYSRGAGGHMDASMDITACHANGTPLKLAALLAADDFNFAHDIGGIKRHLDRSTGELRDFFLPRFSV